MIRPLLLAAALSLAVAVPAGSADRSRRSAPPVCASCLETTVRHLAAPELNGRRCGSEDEAEAARWLAQRMRAAGLRGGFPGGAFLQPATVSIRTPPPGAPETRTTYNVLGVLRGRARDADRRALLLSAHYDGLGVRRGELHPGANDDATGTAAVLEFARALKSGGAPRRTVWFALWGCEEAGGLGARAFLENPAFAPADLSANLEFEMVGERDPKMPDRLMFTGWERSDLGPHLAAQGARVGPDPYPEQNFFRRSDNYALAQQGVVAHTISAWPTPATYHQPTDDAAHVDFAFMAQAVRSLIGPLRRLADGDFAPNWAAGGRP